MSCSGCLLAATAVTLLFRFIYKYIFDKPTLKKFQHPYQEPNVFYYIKYFYYRLCFSVLHPRNKRFNTFSPQGKNSIEAGILPTDTQIKLEWKHDVSNKQETNELRFCGVDIKTGNLLDISLARKKNNKCWSYIYFVFNYNGTMRKYRIPTETITAFEQQGDDAHWVTGDLKIWCLEPLRKWRIFYNGFIEDIITGEIDEVRLSFMWRPYSSVMDHLEISSNEVLARACAKATSSDPRQKLLSTLNQYDIWGAFHGTYTINCGEEQEIVLRGSKTHCIGNINWQSVHRYMLIKMYFEDGSVCSINALSLLSGIPEMFWGYIELSRSETHKITSSDFDFPRMQSCKDFPELFSLRLKTDHDEYILNLRSDQEGFEVDWSSERVVNVKINKIHGVLTNTTQNLVKSGLGSVHYAIQKELISPKTSACAVVPPPVFPKKVTDEDILSKDILAFTDPACTDSALTGGKGSTLAILSSISDEMFIVPSGFCITILAYQKHLLKNPEIVSAINNVINICSGRADGIIEEASNKIVDLFCKSSIADELKNGIIETTNKVFENLTADKKFAVRSSALGEDGEEISGAGQMETKLGCKGIYQICEAVKSCWASLYGFKAIEYRRQNGQIINSGISVVIQEMVPAESAGVMFTRDPITGSPRNVTISANYGLGESVVSASCDPDEITVNRNHKDVLTLGKIVPGKKECKIIMNESGGTEKIQIDQESNKCSLSDELILKLAEIGLYIEKRCGNARDIEWAIVNENIYMLQSRPITSIDQMTELELINEFNTALMTDGDCLSSSNVKEVLPGAISPIWNSFFDEMFEIGQKRLGYLMSDTAADSSMYNRITVQHKWHRFLSKIEMSHKMNEKNPPVQNIQMKNGYDIAINGRIVKDEFTQQVGTERYGYTSRHTKLRNLLAVMKLFSGSQKMVEKIKQTFANIDLKFEGYDNAAQLSRVLFTETEALFEGFVIHISLSMGSIFMNANVFSHLLGTSVEVNEDHYDDFSKLMSVESSTNEVESADIPRSLKELCKAIDKEIGKEKFTSMPAQEAVAWLQSNENPIKKDFDKFIQRHGHRCFKELDVMSKTWSMEPSQLISPLKATMLNLDNCKQVKTMTVDEVLSKLKTDLTSKQKAKLRGIVIKARKYVAFREQAKSFLLKTQHEYRKGLVKLGELMVNEGRVPDGELLMFMSHIEILTLAQARSSTIIQRALKRRKLIPKLEKLTFPEVSYGYPVPIKEEANVLPVDETTIVQGTPVSKGVAAATARVMTSVEEACFIQPGDILVVTATDTAWSPYFPSLSGVVTELGGLVSHGAVVAREFGIPCIVGVADATKMFKSGDFIQINGNKGTIQKLKKQE